MDTLPVEQVKMATLIGISQLMEMWKDMIIDIPELMEMWKEIGEPYIVCSSQPIPVGERVVIAGHPFRVAGDASMELRREAFQRLSRHFPDIVWVENQHEWAYVLTTD